MNRPSLFAESEDTLDLDQRRAVHILSENSEFFLGNALLCFGDSLPRYFTIQSDIHEAPRESDAISILISF